MQTNDTFDITLDIIYSIQKNDLTKVKAILAAGAFNGMGGVDFDIIRFALHGKTDLKIFNVVCDDYILKFNTYGFPMHEMMYSIYETFQRRFQMHFPKSQLFLDKCEKSNIVAAQHFVAIVCYFYNHAEFKSKLKVLPQATQQQICRDVFEYILKHTDTFPGLRYDVKHMISLLSASKYGIDNVNSEGETLLLMACKANKKGLITALLSRGANTNIPDNNGNLPQTFASDIIFQYAKKVLEKELSHIVSNKDSTTKKVM